MTLLNRNGANVSYIYYPLMDKNNLEPKVGAVPEAELQTPAFAAGLERSGKPVRQNAFIRHLLPTDKMY